MRTLPYLYSAVKPLLFVNGLATLGVAVGMAFPRQGWLRVLLCMVCQAVSGADEARRMAIILLMCVRQDWPAALSPALCFCPTHTNRQIVAAATCLVL